MTTNFTPYGQIWQRIAERSGQASFRLTDEQLGFMKALFGTPKHAYRVLGEPCEWPIFQTRIWTGAWLQNDDIVLEVYVALNAFYSKYIMPDMSTAGVPAWPTEFPL